MELEDEVFNQLLSSTALAMQATGGKFLFHIIQWEKSIKCFSMIDAKEREKTEIEEKHVISELHVGVL